MTVPISLSHIYSQSLSVYEVDYLIFILKVLGVNYLTLTIKSLNFFLNSLICIVLTPPWFL